MIIHLHIIELTNFAYGKPAYQSSLGHVHGGAGKAVDGHNTGNNLIHSCTHTAKEASPWWMVDMLQAVTVREVGLIEIFARISLYAPSPPFAFEDEPRLVLNRATQ